MPSKYLTNIHEIERIISDFMLKKPNFVDNELLDLPKWVVELKNMYLILNKILYFCVVDIINQFVVI